jgi:hypothetical protein
LLEAPCVATLEWQGLGERGDRGESSTAVAAATRRIPRVKSVGGGESPMTMTTRPMTGLTQHKGAGAEQQAEQAPRR